MLSRDPVPVGCTVLLTNEHNCSMGLALLVASDSFEKDVVKDSKLSSLPLNVLRIKDIQSNLVSYKLSIQLNRNLKWQFMEMEIFAKLF